LKILGDTEESLAASENCDEKTILELNVSSGLANWVKDPSVVESF